MSATPSCRFRCLKRPTRGHVSHGDGIADGSGNLPREEMSSAGAGSAERANAARSKSKRTSIGISAQSVALRARQRVFHQPIRSGQGQDAESSRELISIEPCRITLWNRGFKERSGRRVGDRSKFRFRESPVVHPHPIPLPWQGEGALCVLFR
jgi:hypothetical protein